MAILIVFLVVWIALRFFTKSPAHAPKAVQSSTEIAAAPPSSTSGAGADSSGSESPSASAPDSSSGTAHHATPHASQQPAAAFASPGVLHQELPNISGSARSTIRGRIKISVQVTTDRSGEVVQAVLGNAGPSKYFARQVETAARKWKFASVPGQDSQQWLLWFELTREGTTARATPQP